MRVGDLGPPAPHDAGGGMSSITVGRIVGLELGNECGLAGIGMHGGQTPYAVLLGDVDQAEVGKERDAEPPEPFEALGIVERQRKHGTGLCVEALHFLRALPGLDLHFGRAEQPGDVEHDPRLGRDVGEQVLLGAGEMFGRGVRDDDRSGHLPRPGTDAHHDAAAQRAVACRHDLVEQGGVLLVVGGVVDAEGRRTLERGGEERRVHGDRDAERGLAGAAGAGADEEQPGAFVGVDAEERAHRTAGEVARGAGHGLHHLLGVELTHQGLADVAEDLSHREHTTELVVREVLCGDVECEADDARHRARLVEHRRVEGVNLHGRAVLAGDAELAFPGPPVEDRLPDLRHQLRLHRGGRDLQGVLADEDVRASSVEHLAVGVREEHAPREVGHEHGGLDVVEEMGLQGDQPRRPAPFCHCASKAQRRTALP